MNNIKNFIQNEEGVMAIEIISAALMTICILEVLYLAIFQPHL